MRRAWFTGITVAAAVVAATGCAETDVRPGFDPASPQDSAASTITVLGPCGANADVAAEEEDDQVIVSVAWRDASGGTCETEAEVELSNAIGDRDLVDEDAERRWALVDGEWVSLDWCGVDARCAKDADIG